MDAGVPRVQSAVDLDLHGVAAGRSPVPQSALREHLHLQLVWEAAGPLRALRYSFLHHHQRRDRGRMAGAAL